MYLDSDAYIRTHVRVVSSLAVANTRSNHLRVSDAPRSEALAVIFLAERRNLTPRAPPPHSGRSTCLT